MKKETSIIPSIVHEWWKNKNIERHEISKIKSGYYNYNSKFIEIESD